MSLNNKWSRKRANLVNEQSDKLTAKIERAQNKLFKYITDTFLPSLETDANEALIPNDKMLFIPSMLDSYYDQFNEEELKPIVSTFASDITKLLKYNQKYYDGVKPSDEHGQIKESVLGALGISGAVIAGGSLLFNILTDSQRRGGVVDLFEFRKYVHFCHLSFLIIASANESPEPGGSPSPHFAPTKLATAIN